MSTAHVIYDDNGVPYSPRKQGAGLMSINDAVNTRGYLSVEGMERPKLELKDDPAMKGVYTMNFTVHNTGSDTLYYDVTPIVLTDTTEAYVNGSGQEFSTISGSSRLLPHTFTTNCENNRVAVAPGKTADVTVTVTVTDEGRAMLAQFPNGSYVEGFVTLTQVAADGSALTDPIDLGLPFLAFYGDWTKAPIMDSTDYWETLDGSASQAQAYMNTAFSSSSENTVDTYLGDNNYTTVPYLADRNAISPNNDDFMDSLTGIYTGLLRNTKSLKYTITGANGQVYYSKDCEYVGKSIYSYDYYRIVPAGVDAEYDGIEPWYGTDAHNAKLPNNTKATVTIEATLPYGDGVGTNQKHSWSFPITIDTEEPHADNLKVTESEGRYYLSLDVSDNQYVAAVVFYNIKNSEMLYGMQGFGEDKPGVTSHIKVLDNDLLRRAKVQGFTDFQIARALGMEEEMDIEEASLIVRRRRLSAGIVPVVKQIDTLAAEYPAQTNYLYMTYSGMAHDIHYEHDKRSIVVLGSGAYRIGSSVEFDWCGVQALNTIRKEGFRSVMINYNPETVSTDYDMCDRLYFDELTFERGLDILDLECPKGVIVSTGGQIPNNLAIRLDQQRIPILGTTAKSIDNAEDREKFSAMLNRIGVDQPEWSALTSMDDVNAFIDKVGFPVLVRPSYVLSGAAMNVCSNQDELERFLKLAANVSHKHPVVISKFLQHAKEVEMDAVAREGEIVAYAISEHIEFAGVHSGDATIQFPAQKLYVETVRRIKKISGQIARELKISGPFNIQFLAKDNDIKVIECNLRASRSFPFVSKVLKINMIELATKVMLGLPVEKPNKSLFDFDYVGIKASQFSFNRLQKADPVLGVDMASTGEVGCLGDDSGTALLTAMLSVGHRIPKKNILLSTGGAKQKADMLEAARTLKEHGYTLYATGGTSRYLTENGVENNLVYWPSEEGTPQALTMLHNREIDMVVNIPKDLTVSELSNGYKIRRAAVDLNIPLITNSRLASAFIQAFCHIDMDDLPIKSWSEYK